MDKLWVYEMNVTNNSECHQINKFPIHLHQIYIISNFVKLNMFLHSTIYFMQSAQYKSVYINIYIHLCMYVNRIKPNVKINADEMIEWHLS